MEPFTTDELLTKQQLLSKLPFKFSQYIDILNLTKGVISKNILPCFINELNKIPRIDLDPDTRFIKNAFDYNYYIKENDISKIYVVDAETKVCISQITVAMVDENCIKLFVDLV
ncbi:ac26-like protein [Cryptophlebia peltastica nucleopolyhedrovirus]|uniref:Ac26-like protein n=1 Tax=Cryptophlebia peltastica nucleopolyhedrovirus TaxID=2304025 RepID=A0A346RNN1_9ABAC|nr:ac26-like protein [Cryptophlebia peltastica nucleopolyhedrovirus]AXS67678.1 ac26-like protein [Cryptophlebia peltastica nucleopolyhedrovirus]